MGALVAKLAGPIQRHLTRCLPALPADDHPIDAPEEVIVVFKVEVYRPQQGLRTGSALVQES